MNPTGRLQYLILRFLNNEISGKLFETEFADYWDFEDLEVKAQEYEYFSQVRELLERFTDDAEDLKKHPEYYWNTEQLQEQIRKLPKM